MLDEKNNGGEEELDREAQELAQHKVLNEQLESYGVELPEGSTVAQKLKTLKRLEGKVVRIKTPGPDEAEKLTELEREERQLLAETWRG